MLTKLLTASFLVVVLGCSLHDEGVDFRPERDSSPQREPVKMSISVSVEGKALEILGTTSLPDAAVVSCEATTLTTPAQADWETFETVVRGGTTAVAHGAFEMTIELAKMVPGQAETLCVFWPGVQTAGEQPDHILELYHYDRGDKAEARMPFVVPNTL